MNKSSFRMSLHYTVILVVSTLYKITFPPSSLHEYYCHSGLGGLCSLLGTLFLERHVAVWIWHVMLQNAAGRGHVNSTVAANNKVKACYHMNKQLLHLCSPPTSNPCFPTSWHTLKTAAHVCSTHLIKSNIQRYLMVRCVICTLWKGWVTATRAPSFQWPYYYLKWVSQGSECMCVCVATPLVCLLKPSHQGRSVLLRMV